MRSRRAVLHPHAGDARAVAVQVPLSSRRGSRVIERQDPASGQFRNGFSHASLPWVGTWGTGAFDSDDALDLLDTLTGQDAAQRRQALELVFRTAAEHPQDLDLVLGRGEVVAAAAVVAAGLGSGEAITAEITKRGYGPAAVLIPGSDPALADAALAALLIAAGRDGPWHQGWVDAETALQARRTTDQLASILSRYQRRHDQELPLES